MAKKKRTVDYTAKQIMEKKVEEAKDGKKPTTRFGRRLKVKLL